MHVSPSDGGTIKVDQIVPSSYPATFTFANGESVRLQAMPTSGYQFDGWSEDLSGTSNPTTIVIDCDKQVTANFSQAEPDWWLPSSIIAGAVIIGVVIWFTVRSRTA